MIFHEAFCRIHPTRRPNIIIICQVGEAANNRWRMRKCVCWAWSCTECKQRTRRRSQKVKVNSTSCASLLIAIRPPKGKQRRKLRKSESTMELYGSLQIHSFIPPMQRLIDMEIVWFEHKKCRWGKQTMSAVQSARKRKFMQITQFLIRKNIFQLSVSANLNFYQSQSIAPIDLNVFSKTLETS